MADSGRSPVAVATGRSGLLRRRGGATALGRALLHRDSLEALALAVVLALAGMVTRLAVRGALTAVDAVAMHGLASSLLGGLGRCRDGGGGYSEDGGGSGDAMGGGMHGRSPGGKDFAEVAW